jgi:Subunit ChlI of Mg-chelatase
MSAFRSRFIPSQAMPPLARTSSVALVGVAGHVIEVEVDIANGLVGMILVGLPDIALPEARDRIRAAIANSGEQWPQRKITVGLSQASLPKGGSWFDLAAAITDFQRQHRRNVETSRRGLTEGVMDQYSLSWSLSRPSWFQTGHSSCREDVPAFVELESGGPPPVACRVVGVGQLPSHPTKEGDRREQHLSEEPPPCPA